MNHTTEAPRGQALAGQTAGRQREAADGDYPRGYYHGRPRRASGRALVVVTPQGSRTVGRLEGRGDVLVFVKIVHSERHLLQYPEPAWAVDECALSEAQAAGATRVEVRDERGRVWYTRLPYLLEAGEVIDRGFGRQYALALVRWSFDPGRREQLRLIGGGD